MTRPDEKTVLVVDDEPNVRDYLRTLLEDAGFNVVTASDGHEALELIRQQPPDFISLDLIMPKKSGQKLLYELKKDRALARIPVLIVTAHAQDELGQSSIEELLDQRVMSGPGTYLEKPVDPRAYVRSIQRALGVAETPEVTERLSVKEELQAELQQADAAALRRALAALKKK